MGEKLEKYLPFIIGGALVLIGVYLYRGGYGKTTGTQYSVANPPDNAAALLQAQVQSQAGRLQAGLTGFQTLVGYVSQRDQTRASLQATALNDWTYVSGKFYDAQTQQYAVQQGNKTARQASNNSLWGSIIGAVATYGIYALA